MPPTLPTPDRVRLARPLHQPASDRWEAAAMEEIQHFYARHLQLLDSGEADGWAATFTEHGSFLAPGLPEPVVGRAALAAGAKARHRQLEEAGEVHRHWHGMIAATPSGEEVEVRCYALIIATPAGGPPRLHRSCVCEDVLVPDGEHWLIRRRRVTVDGG